MSVARNPKAMSTLKSMLGTRELNKAISKGKLTTLQETSSKRLKASLPSITGLFNLHRAGKLTASDDLKVFAVASKLFRFDAEGQQLATTCFLHTDHDLVNDYESPPRLIDVIGENGGTNKNFTAFPDGTIGVEALMPNGEKYALHLKELSEWVGNNSNFELGDDYGLLEGDFTTLFSPDGDTRYFSSKTNPEKNFIKVYQDDEETEHNYFELGKRPVFSVADQGKFWTFGQKKENGTSIPYLLWSQINPTQRVEYPVDSSDENANRVRNSRGYDPEESGVDWAGVLKSIKLPDNAQKVVDYSTDNTAHKLLLLTRGTDQSTHLELYSPDGKTNYSHLFPAQDLAKLSKVKLSGNAETIVGVVKDGERSKIIVSKVDGTQQYKGCYRASKGERIVDARINLDGSEMLVHGIDQTAERSKPFIVKVKLK